LIGAQRKQDKKLDELTQDEIEIAVANKKDEEENNDPGQDYLDTCHAQTLSAVEPIHRNRVGS
jgi:hypothetical protein